MSKDHTKRALLALALAAAMLAPAGVAQADPGCTAQQGQALIDDGQLQKAVHEFTCVIDAQPTEVEGYRGRIEAELLLGRYSDAMADHARVTAHVVPVHPDANATILAAYADRLAAAPDDIPALTGASFARWTSFDYPQAIQVLNHLLEVRPDDPFGILFRGSSRLLHHAAPAAKGVADLERAIALAPDSPDVRWIVADAYTYGKPDLQRAFAEASLALDWGLDTPRVHAILATAYNAFGDLGAAAEQIDAHIDAVTTDLVTTSPLAAGQSFTLDLVPGRTYAIPVAATAGEKISISTDSRDFADTIAVLLAPGGSPVVGSDDANRYMAAIDWVAEETGTYMLHVTSFESIDTGALVVSRA